MDSVNTELIRGHVDTIILKALMQRDRYGYEILDIISDLSEGRYEIKQPTLYSCLKRLEKQGFITSYYGDETQGGRRRYYKLTEKGRATLEQDQREWEFSRTIINRLLSDKEIDLRTVEAPFNPSELRPLTRRVKVYDDGNVNNDTEEEEESSETPIAVQPTAAQFSSQSTTVAPTQDTGSTLLPKILAERPSEAVAAAVSEAPQTDAPLSDTKKSNIYDEEELLRIKEQQIAASKRLQIGEFAERRMLVTEEDDVPHTPASYGSPRNGAGDAAYGYSDQPPRPAAPDRSMFTYTTMSADKMPPKPQTEPQIEKRDDYLNNRTTAEQDERLHYKAALSALFRTDESEEKAKPQQKPYEPLNEAEEKEIDSQGRARHFGDLKQSLYEEGYNLKPYNKANASNFYYMKFVYSNKLMRDTALFTYLVLIIEVLIMIIALNSFAINIGVCIAIAAVGLVVPVIPFIMWAANPTKRIKARFNLGTSITYALIAFIVISGISMIISLIAPSLKVDFTKGSAYIPVMIAALIPIAVLIYGLLYRSGNYHLKK